jgi:acetyltransferase-like isoleucine patch superfamily enzyme
MVLGIVVGLCRGVVRALFFRSHGGFVLLKRGVILKNTQYLSVGRQFIAEERCEINGLSKRGLVFGDRVTVGAFALIRPSNQYGGHVGEGLMVGDNSNIGPFSYIGCSGFITIGKNVMMGPRVGLYAENHAFDRTDVPMNQQGVRHEEIHIEDDCWLGANCIVLAGVRIGKGTVVSAGSVVTHDIPPYSIIGGIPAKVTKSREQG